MKVADRHATDRPRYKQICMNRQNS